MTCSIVAVWRCAVKYQHHSLSCVSTPHHPSLPSPETTRSLCIVSRHACIQVGERKENSKMARLKRHLEKVGFKGLGDSRESGSNRQKALSKPGSTSIGENGDGDELSRLGVGLASSPIESRATAGGGVATGRSPTARGYRSDEAHGLVVGGVGGAGGEGVESGAEPTRLATLSPRRFQSSLSMSGRRLSAWTLGRVGTEGNRTTLGGCVIICVPWTASIYVALKPCSSFCQSSLGEAKSIRRPCWCSYMRLHWRAN